VFVHRSSFYIKCHNYYNDEERDLIYSIPQNESLTATKIIGARLSERKEIYLFPDKYDSSDWVCVDDSDIESTHNQTLHGRPEFTEEYSLFCLKELKQESENPNGTYELVGNSGSVWLFKRRV